MDNNFFQTQVFAPQTQHILLQDQSEIDFNNNRNSDDLQNNFEPIIKSDSRQIHTTNRGLQHTSKEYNVITTNSSSNTSL